MLKAFGALSHLLNNALQVRSRHLSVHGSLHGVNRVLVRTLVSVGHSEVHVLTSSFLAHVRRSSLTSFR